MGFCGLDWGCQTDMLGVWKGAFGKKKHKTNFKEMMWDTSHKAQDFLLPPYNAVISQVREVGEKIALHNTTSTDFQMARSISKGQS
jgi:hypothetical protein